METADTRNESTGEVGAVSVSPSTSLLAWSVHVIVCGLYVGAYKFATEASARADADDRRRKFGVLGCRYIVEANKEIDSK